jgi:hypothetical protein
MFNNKKKILAPSRWFNDNTNTEGLYRDDFERIEV